MNLSKRDTTLEERLSSVLAVTLQKDPQNQIPIMIPSKETLFILEIRLIFNKNEIHMDCVMEI